MKVKDIVAVIEEFAPLSLQESFDNSGLLVGRPDDEVNSVLLCVDITEAVMGEAESTGAGMVVAHHPVIFQPLRSLTDANYVERVVARAVRAGIALYASHTNLDAVHNGLSFKLAEMLGVERPRVLSPLKSDCPTTGFGIVGELANAMPTEKFLRHVMRRLNLKSLRYSDFHTPQVQRIALCSGSGSSQIENAVGAGADIFLAADLRYNNFLDAAGRITIADIGHFESEYCAIDVLHDVISKKMPTFVVRTSVNSRNPVNYLV
ncbi:MAG: Nif3-like dinuclear metal center hexameric protein [Rikenellaceae bacterium]|nr:Nif3-like dinuclear metal center hexameric protein [Rikenellaceae bacterium]MCL2692803.1 Nif3-like dinuclear metal center hexameric protein [Rikenellaceae bacterium]